MPRGNFPFKRYLTLSYGKGWEMSTTFTPVETLELFCRFCGKITPCQLDRSIAENGRTIDRTATFEYYCTKCFKTACFCGNDLLEQIKVKPDKKQLPREYSPMEHYYIGERIFHKKFKTIGLVVGKESGIPSTIIVLFEKGGIKKLIQDVK
jgi:hypothetical protein